MKEQLVDDELLCEDSPYNLEVDHFSIAVGESLYKTQSDNLRKDTLQPEILADTFHSLFAHEVALHPAADRKAEAWWREFFVSGQAGKLRSKTVGQQQMAEVACWEIARSLREYCEKERELAGEDGESFDGIFARSRSVKDACEKAEDELDDAENLGCSLGPGAGKQISTEDFKHIADRMRKSKTLRKILEISGAMMTFRGAVKKKKIEGFDCVDGVMQSGDITRLLPSELMQLAGPEAIATNMLRRLVENQTLALRKHSKEKAGRGPIVVLIDGSGSMEGGWRRPGPRPIDEAKALALTMARIALEQKRWIVLVEFGSGSEWRELVLQPDNWDAKGLVAWLEHFFGGGTDFNCLVKAAQSWDRWKCPKGKVDLIFATDCRARLSDHIVKTFSEFKKERDVKCYGLAINSDVGDLGLITDHAVTTSSMGLESHAIREILSGSA